MRVVLAGGGSAGHIEPALALADALREEDPGGVIVCLGTERGLETRLVPMRGYELALIPAVPMPRAVSPALIAVPGRLAGAVSAAAGVLDRVKADVLVGFGGYVATPGYLAARRRHVPIVVHEANPRPGLANKLGARLTGHVFTGNPSTQLAHATYLGIPIRREIAELDRLALGDKARAHFGLRPDLPVLLVTGGSQGAQSLNRAVYAAIGWLRSAGVQVLHVTGPRNAGEAPAAPTGGAPYIPVPYVDRMDLAYAAADFALCRAGAMTCAELTAVGLPGAFVPLPHGNGEQRLNAEPIVAGGGGLLVEDADLTPEWIRDVLLPVLLDIDRVANMSEAAAALGRADADRQLARAVIEIVRAGEDAPPGDRPVPATPPGGNAEHWFDPASRRNPAERPRPGGQPDPGPPPMPRRQPRPASQPMPGERPLPGEPPMLRRQPWPASQPMPGAPPGPGPNLPDPWFGPGPGPGNDTPPRRDGPPWPEAEPQPGPAPRRAAPSRRGQPRHGRPRRGA
jgi:UDP-N-acetylglucosamine--N-acetylmuramyl-(pentapeptide) pyrophosphoryl-undecaprenol N-acetylglucosamine transferase